MNKYCSSSFLILNMFMLICAVSVLKSFKDMAIFVSIFGLSLIFHFSNMIYLNGNKKDPIISTVPTRKSRIIMSIMFFMSFYIFFAK